MHTHLHTYTHIKPNQQMLFTQTLAAHSEDHLEVFSSLLAEDLQVQVEVEAVVDVAGVLVLDQH